MNAKEAKCMHYLEILDAAIRHVCKGGVIWGLKHPPLAHFKFIFIS